MGVANPPSLIPALWNIGILLHKQATHPKHFWPECISSRARHNYVSTAYFEPQKKFKKIKNVDYKKNILCNFLVWTLQYLRKNIFLTMKTCPQKQHTLQPIFFSVLPTGPKLKFCSKKIAHHARVMYNDFACSSSGHWWVSETTT